MVRKNNWRFINYIFTKLTLFLNATTITDFTGNMAAVAGLTSGLGKDISAVNEKSKKIDTLFDKNAIMDLDPIYKSKTWQSTYLKIFNQIKNDLLPVTFLSASENFQGILNKVLDNMNTNTSEFTEETRAKISRDLLSYLTIKAYQQGKNTKSIETLSNNLIYPEGEYRSINDIVEALSKTEAGKDNFFLDSFAISEKASDDKNQTGLNKLNANTFRSLNAGQKVDLQNSFAKLYGSLETKEDAIAIVHYIMVKDGLQLTYSTKFGSKYGEAYGGESDPLEPRSEFISPTHRYSRKLIKLTEREQLINDYIQTNRMKFVDITNAYKKYITPMCSIGNRGLYVSADGVLHPCSWVSYPYKELATDKPKLLCP